MATKLSLASINKQIAALDAKRAKILQGKDKAIRRVRQEVSAFGLTADDIFGQAPKAVRPNAKAAKSVGKVSTAKRSNPAKYTDGTHSWTGVGKRPRWFVSAIASGTKPGDFLVGAAKPSSSSAASSAPAPAKTAAAGKTKAAGKKVVAKSAPPAVKQAPKTVPKASAKTASKTIAKAAKPAAKAAPKPAAKAAAKPAAKKAALKTPESAAAAASVKGASGS